MADVAFHRSVSVTVGVVWAAIISRLWWPAEARRELSKALGELSCDRQPYWKIAYIFLGF